MRALRNFVFALLPALGLLGVFALGFLGDPENDPWLNASPLWGPGDPFYSPDPESAHALADPALIWRGRPRYEGVIRYLEAGIRDPYRTNAQGFRDDEILDPKPAGTVRVVNLGDSATWGLNLRSPADTYSGHLQRILGSDFDVVNAGVVGYSSFQGCQFVRHGLARLDPDVVTAYFGNNDPSPSSLKDAARAAAAAGPLHGLLARNRFYLLLTKGLLHLRAARLDRDRGALGLLGAEQSREAYYRAGARVSPEEYEDNLRKIVSGAREAGSRPILLKIPTNLFWPPRVRPFADQVLRPTRYWAALKIEPGYLARTRSGRPACLKAPVEGHPYLCRVTAHDLKRAGLPSAAELSAQTEDPDLDAPERLRAAHNAAVRSLVEGDGLEARRRLDAMIAAASACDCVAPKDLAWAYYNRGVARFQLGEAQAAFEDLRASRGVWPFAMSPDYDARFDRVVRELDVEWIDLPRRFAEQDPRFAGSALILDWVHPDSRGGAVIAEALAERLATGERTPPGANRPGKGDLGSRMGRDAPASAQRKRAQQGAQREAARGDARLG